MTKDALLAMPIEDFGKEFFPGKHISDVCSWLDGTVGDRVARWDKSGSQFMKFRGCGPAAWSKVLQVLTDHGIELPDPHVKEILPKINIMQDQALKMLRRLGNVDKLPDAIARRLESLKVLLQRRPTASEIALVISQCEGEKVLADNMHAGFESAVIPGGWNA